MPEQPSADPLTQVLQELRRRRGDVIGVAIASVDGFPIASDVPPDVEGEELAALSAELFSQSSRSSTQFGGGDLTELYARGEQGYLVVMKAGEEGLLVCLAAAEASLGMLMVELRKAAEQVEEQL
ncbi:MAG: roadblock/LC7 domain-containing protein [Armatimonadota bacterium]